jgi:hypothetical protein
MPVKAKAVEYVKICSLYGAGFYYIPGTDTCLKIGGYLRVQTESKAGASGQVYGTGGVLGSARYDRFDSNDINWTVRAVMSFDARTQTDYGTLRSYIRAGWNQSTPAVAGAGTTPCNVAAANNCLAYWDRAFIQFAGFTVGRAQSFFDMYTFGGAYTYLNTRTSGDTGAAGEDLWAYTVQFGNGVSYSLSLEDPAAHNKYGTYDNTAAGFFAFGVATAANSGFTIQGASNNGFRVPDVITNLRVDQAWGYLGVSTAIHDVSGGYYGAVPNVNNGHPATTYGWAASFSGFFNLQGGDSFGFNVVWAKGAPGYAFNSGNWQLYNNSNSVGVAWAGDAVFGNGTTVELTKAWSINAGYQHIWGPAGTFGGKWRTTVYGGYVSVDYSDRATQLINAGLPAGNVCGGGAVTTFTGWTPLAGNSCSPDFSFYQVGSRTQFNPHPLMDIGLDVFYTRLNSAYKGPVNYVANGARPACTNSAIISCTADDQGVLSAIVRWQRNFYP